MTATFSTPHQVTSRVQGPYQPYEGFPTFRQPKASIPHGQSGSAPDLGCMYVHTYICVCSWL